MVLVLRFSLSDEHVAWQSHAIDLLNVRRVRPAAAQGSEVCILDSQARVRTGVHEQLVARVAVVVALEQRRILDHDACTDLLTTHAAVARVDRTFVRAADVATATADGQIFLLLVATHSTEHGRGRHGAPILAHECLDEHGREHFLAIDGAIIHVCDAQMRVLAQDVLDVVCLLRFVQQLLALDAHEVGQVCLVDQLTAVATGAGVLERTVLLAGQHVPEKEKRRKHNRQSSMS
jgi:hypothetical protein